MPEPDYAWLPKDTILSFEEIDTIVGAFSGLGVDRVRSPAPSRSCVATCLAHPRGGRAPRGTRPGADDQRRSARGTGAHAAEAGCTG